VFLNVFLYRGSTVIQRRGSSLGTDAALQSVGRKFSCTRGNQCIPFYHGGQEGSEGLRGAKGLSSEVLEEACTALYTGLT